MCGSSPERVIAHYLTDNSLPGEFPPWGGVRLPVCKGGEGFRRYASLRNPTLPLGGNRTALCFLILQLSFHRLLLSREGTISLLFVQL